MKALRTPPKEVWDAFESVKTWEDWYHFVDTYFDWDQAPERTLAQLEQDLNRTPVEIGGIQWKPYAENYDVDPQIEVMFADMSAQIFARLEPQEHVRNTEQTDNIGWKCPVCRLYTEACTSTCPTCGQRLLRMPL